jgi:glyoxylase I family protein
MNQVDIKLKAAAAAAPISVRSLHHFAWRCKDAEETRHFYEDILELPLVHTVFHERVPSTQEFHPYYHFFFRLRDGSCLAFFDLLDNKAWTPDPATPTWVNHIAFNVDSMEELQSKKQKLEQNGISVLGPTDHGWFHSIYFFDPNGIRLELLFHTGSDELLAKFAAEAHEKLSDVAEKRAKYGLAK